MRTTLTIEGMSCGHCEAAVKGALTAISGITSVVVDLNTKTAVVEHGGVSDEAMKNAVEEQGYDVVAIAP